MKGTYNQYLFRTGTLNGEISVESYNSNEQKQLIDVEFHDGIRYLIYINVENMLTINSFGFLMSASDFSDFLIAITDSAEIGSKVWS